MLSYREFLLRPPLLNEVSTKVINDVLTRVGEIDPKKLPLKSVFGSQIRVVLPLGTDELQDFTTQLANHGFVVDYAHGTATKEIQTKQGTKKQSVKIGRAVELLVKSKAIDAKWWAYWNKKNESIVRQSREDPKFIQSLTPEYSIIISRSPVDLLRMSDFPDISSCHSEGGRYFDCAVQEATGGGAIAYLVNTKDLKKVPDLQAKEIFADPARRINGITPFARLRIRLFVKGEMQLGLPERRMYPDAIPGFRETVMEFMRKQQEPVVQGSRPRMKDFQLRGGSYTDNFASALFNDFFGDNLDHGTVGHQASKNDEAAMEAMNDQLRREIEQIDRADNTNFVNPVSVSYDEGDEPGEDGQIDFHWDAYVQFDFPARNWVVQPENYTKRYELKKQINKMIPDGHFEEVDVDDVGARKELTHFDWNNKDANGDFIKHAKTNPEYLRVPIHVNCRVVDDGFGHPDQYRAFIQEVKSTYDQSYQAIYAAIRGVLVENGYLRPGIHDKLVDVVHNDRFQHFSWDDEHPYEAKDQEDLAVRSEPIKVIDLGTLRRLIKSWPVPDPQSAFHNPHEAFTRETKSLSDNTTGYWPGFSNAGKFNLVRDAAMEKIHQWLGQQQVAQQRQQVLPGFQQPNVRNSATKMLEPILTFSWRTADTYHLQTLVMQILFPFSWTMSNADVVRTLRGIHLIDQHFDRFVDEVQRAVVTVFEQEIKRFQSQKRT